MLDAENLRRLTNDSIFNWNYHFEELLIIFKNINKYQIN